MKKFLIISAASTTVLGLVMFVQYVNFVGSTMALHELHPQLDYETVYKAHTKLCWRIMKGDFTHLDLNDEAVLDRLFLEEAARITYL